MAERRGEERRGDKRRRGGYGVDIISIARGRQVGGNAILSSQFRRRGSNTRAGWWVRGRCPRGCYPLSSLFPTTPSPPPYHPAHTAHRPISPLPSFVARSSTEFPGVDCASSRELLA